MKKWLWLSIYAISMAYLEAAVVVYLRFHYYPRLTQIFPLAPMQPKIYFIELGREAATIFMLLSVGVLSSKNLWQAFFDFLFVFGLWGIFYYFWLKVLINWPGQLFTWDVLFLIPVPWFAPWITPAIVAFVFVVAGFFFSRKLEVYRPVRFKLSAFLFFVADSLIFVSYVFVPVELLFTGGVPKLQEFEPTGNFPWLVYIAGLILLVFSAWHFNKKLEPWRNKNE